MNEKDHVEYFVSRAGRLRAEVSEEAVAAIEDHSRKLIAAKVEGGSEGESHNGTTDRVRRNVVGFVGEYAACPYYRTRFDWTIHEGRGDKGWDIEAAGKNRTWKIDVKSTACRSLPLLVTKYWFDRLREKPDLFLSTLVCLESRIVVFRGYCPRKTLIHATVDNWQHSKHESYIVPLHDLKPIPVPKDIQGKNLPDWYGKKTTPVNPSAPTPEPKPGPEPPEPEGERVAEVVEDPFPPEAVYPSWWELNRIFDDLIPAKE